MDDPRITLVMPSYNQVEFLPQAIESVLTQGYDELEFLLLDGGSDDGSLQVIQQFADRLTWWRSEPDQGQAAALREGFARGTGEIFCWLNSDDRLSEGALEHVAEVWKTAGGEVIVAGGCQLFGDKSSGQRHVPWFTELRGQPVKMPLTSVLDMGGHWFPGEFFYQPEVFFPASAYRAVGGIDARFYYTMDFDLWARFALAGVPVVVVETTLAWYREHDHQKTDDRQALYREMVATANHYLGVSGLPPLTVRRLQLANRVALVPGVRRMRQVIACGKRALSA